MSAALSIRPCLDPAVWDEAIWALPNGNVFASWMWGAYKSQVGWAVTRLIVRDASEAPVGLIQVQVKRRGFVRFVLLQGCPLLTEKGEKHAEAVVALLLEHLALGRLDLLAVSFEHFQSDAILLALLGHGFVPAQSAKYFTLELDLTGGTAPLLQAMDQRWRKALRKAERNPDLTTRFLTDLDERLAAFDAFWTMYGAHVSGRRFTDFYTASNDRARACAAPTLAVWRFVEQAHAEGRETFDFGGIDPAGNRGVFEFKHGLSKRPALSGPRWIYGRTPRLRDAAAAFLSYR
jgi:hypothetical protein